jgi:hypothetical protein
VASPLLRGEPNEHGADLIRSMIGTFERQRANPRTVPPGVRVVAASTPDRRAVPFPGEPREACPWQAEAQRGGPGGGAPREEGVQGEETGKLWITRWRCATGRDELVFADVSQGASRMIDAVHGRIQGSDDRAHGWP